VIVHIDSPGGYALASDLIWRELALLNAEKPVIVYMGDVAASGGYYLAVAGRKIVAQRATLTGSIGVIAAKANLSDAFARFGARRDEVRRGTHAGIYGDTTAWQGDLLERIEQSVHHTYTTFQARVLAGRQLSPDQLSLLAGGRVWTGVQALQHGLVDALGDFTEAVAVALSEAGLPAGSRCDLIPVTLPSRWQPPQPAAWLGGPLGRQTADLATFLLEGELVRQLEREQLWLLAPSRITLEL
jgi:protease-4